MTWTGNQPINNKVEAIVKMIPQKNTKEVRAFIGIVNYYRDMWVRRSHLLHLLTELTSNKVKLIWTRVEHKAFDDIKHALAQDTLLAYTYFNRHFDIHIDSREPIAFYSRKLTGLQTQYLVTEKKLLSVVETLK